MLSDNLLPLIFALPSVALHLLVKLPISVFLISNILFNLAKLLVPIHRFQPLLQFLRLYAGKLLDRLQSDSELINISHDNPGLVLYADSIHSGTLVAALCRLIARLNTAEFIVARLETVDLPLETHLLQGFFSELLCQFYSIKWNNEYYQR